MMLTISDRFVIVRKQRKLTLADIAVKTDISEDVLHAIEMDMYMPSFNEVIKISDALDVSIDFIAGRISQNIDPVWLDRFDDIQLMSEEKQQTFTSMLDAYIQHDKVQQIYNPTDTNVKVKKNKMPK